MANMTQNRTDFSAIRLVIFDVDGVLTDGTLCYDQHGETTKSFHVRDGVGIGLLKDNDIEVAVITAKDSLPLARRMEDLNIHLYFPGCTNKKVAFDSLKKQVGISNEQIAYVGDDVLDLSVMKEVALAIAPADAYSLVLKCADVVTKASGGQGVAREVADLLVAPRVDLEQAYNKLFAVVQ